MEKITVIVIRHHRPIPTGYRQWVNNKEFKKLISLVKSAEYGIIIQ
jgi:hypothetical protein